MPINTGAIEPPSGTVLHAEGATETASGGLLREGGGGACMHTDTVPGIDFEQLQATPCDCPVTGQTASCKVMCMCM